MNYLIKYAWVPQILPRLCLSLNVLLPWGRFTKTVRKSFIISSKLSFVQLLFYQEIKALNVFVDGSKARREDYFLLKPAITDKNNLDDLWTDATAAWKTCRQNDCTAFFSWNKWNLTEPQQQDDRWICAIIWFCEWWNFHYFWSLLLYPYLESFRDMKGQ